VVAPWRALILNWGEYLLKSHPIGGYFGGTLSKFFTHSCTAPSSSVLNSIMCALRNARKEDIKYPLTNGIVQYFIAVIAEATFISNGLKFGPAPFIHLVNNRELHVLHF